MNREFLKQLVRWPAVVALIVGALGAGFVTYELMEPPDVQHEITVVDQGVLYRSGQLSSEDLSAAIKIHGIRTVINLGSRTDWDRDVCQKEGVEYVDLPVGDVWCMCGTPAPGYDVKPDAPYDLSPFWQAIDDPARRPVLIHCWGGIHRTGVLAAMYRIQRQGWKAEEALAEMRLYGFTHDKAKFESVIAYLRSLEGKHNLPTRLAEGAAEGSAK